MRRKLTIIISAGIIAIFGIFIFRHYAKPTQAMDTAIWVKAEPVQQQDLALEATAIGTLVAAKSIEMTPEVNGHVEKILFQDGSYVKQHAPLIQLDNQTAYAALVSAKASLAYAEADYKRKRWLGKQGAIARQAIEQAEADWQEKKALELERAIAYEKTQLTAPFAGMVGKRKINVGDYVTVGQSVVTLTDIQHLRVEYSVSEKYVSQLKRGQTITVTTSAYPDRKFLGTVAFISPTINAAEHTLSLYADIPNEQGILMPGMFINLTQSLGLQHQAMVIPARALVPAVGGEQVYRIVDGKAQAVSVVIGNRVGDKVQILRGLALGDRVVTDGQLKLQDGVPVQVITR